MHADRTNRIMLTLFALVLLAVGTIGALAGFGAFGQDTAKATLLSDRVRAYFGEHGGWLWVVIAAAAALIALLALWWLIALLFTTDRIGDITLAGDRSAGRTTIASGALTHAVTEEIETYPGIREARTRLIGHAASPRLVIIATLEQGADLASLRRRIETQAASHARQALDNPALPVQLDLTVSDRQHRRVS
ncbi:MAG TPA: alkaline shock response membrane anchor protein AmaP [Actinomycetes bacterium]